MQYVEATDDEEDDEEGDGMNGSEEGRDVEKEVPVKIGPPKKKQKVITSTKEPSIFVGSSMPPAPPTCPRHLTPPTPPIIPVKVKVKDGKGKKGKVQGVEIALDHNERPATRSRTKEPLPKEAVNKASK